MTPAPAGKRFFSLGDEISSGHAESFDRYHLLEFLFTVGS
jgi:hypothetical protein